MGTPEEFTGFDFEWEPKTHMRDFEIILSENTEVMVARGQGPCVIIIKPLGLILN